MPQRHVLRSIFRIRYRLVVIAMICASAFGILAGGYSAIDSLFFTVDQVQSKADMADIELLFAPDDAKNLPDFSGLDGVASVANRLVMSGQATLRPSESVSALLVAAPPAQFGEINRLTLLSGTLPDVSNSSHIALERNCAKFYAKKPGDVIDLRIGYENYKLTVSGIVQSPEYMIAPLDPSVYVPASGSLCVMYGVDQLLHDKLGFAATDSVLLRLAPGTNVADQKAKILELAQTRLSVDYALTRHEQFSQKFLELDLNTFKVFFPAVVLIFTLSSVLVVFFLMYQWIRDERPLIAMMLTLGYTRHQLFRAYLLPAVAMIVLALLLGFGLASFDMWAFGTNYAKAIGMPVPILHLQPHYILLATVLVVAAVSFGMLLPLSQMLRITPLDALRDLPPSALSTGWMLRLAARIRGPLWFSYALRNLLRSWRVSAVSILAVAASVAVTLAFYISLTSMERTAVGSVSRDNWHAVVDLDAPIWSDELGRFSDAVAGSQWSAFVKGGAQIVSHGLVSNAFLLGVVSADQVRNINLIVGRELRDSDTSAVVIERRLAADHHKSIGEMIGIKGRGEIHQARIVGIHSSAVPGEIIVPRQFAQHMLSLDDQFTGAFLIAPQPDASQLQALQRINGVIRVTTKQDIVASILEISGHIWKIIHLSAVISIGVSALFILTSITFTVMSRRAEYGMLRIIGHRGATVAAIILFEASVMTVLACLLAMPAGLAIGTLLNDRLTYVWFKVNTHASVMDYVQVLLPTLLLAPMAAIPAIRAVFRIAPVDIIKERKFG